MSKVEISPAGYEIPDGYLLLHLMDGTVYLYTVWMVALLCIDYTTTMYIPIVVLMQVVCCVESIAVSLVLGGVLSTGVLHLLLLLGGHVVSGTTTNRLVV